MKFALMLFLATGFFVLPQAFAKEGVGNGGNILVCTEPPPVKVSYKVLDYHLAKKRGIDIEVGEPGWDFSRRVKHVLDRLHKVDPTRAEKYWAWFLEFFNEVEWDDKISRIPDIGVVGIPENCEPRTVIGQKDPKVMFRGDKRYTVGKTLWKVIDDSVKSGLITHELVYREALESGQITAEAVQYFTSMISSPAMNTITYEDYYNLIMSVGFKTFDYRGVTVDIDRASFTIKGNQLELNPGHETLPLASGSLIRPLEVASKGRGNVQFYESGAIKSLWLPNSEITQCYSLGCLVIGDKSHVHDNDGVTLNLHENGMLKEARIAKPSRWVSPDFELTLNGDSFPKLDERGYPLNARSLEQSRAIVLGEWREVRRISYFRNGPLEKVFLAQPIEIEILGAKLKIEAIEFRADGTIRTVRLATPTLVTISGMPLIVGALGVDNTRSRFTEAWLARRSQVKYGKDKMVVDTLYWDESGNLSAVRGGDKFKVGGVKVDWKDCAVLSGGRVTQLHSFLGGSYRSRDKLARENCRPYSLDINDREEYL
jgi:hypothetical protein